MPIKLLYTIYGTSLLLDLFVASLFGYPLWFPYFSLAFLPGLMMFSNQKVSFSLVILQSLALWLFAQVNAGISLFSMGLLYISLYDIIKKIFHTTTWQPVAAMCLALSISLFILGFLSQASTNIPFFTSRFLIGVSLTTITAFVASIIIQKNYA